MTKRQKALVAAAFLALILIMGIAVYSKRAAVLRPNLSAVVTKQLPVDALETQWAEDEFIPLTAENIKDFASSIPIESKGFLTESESLELRDTVARLLQAYSSSGIEQFLSFRFPITNGVFTKSLLEYDRSYVSKNGKELLSSKDIDTEMLENLSAVDIWKLKLALPSVQAVTNRWRAVGRKGSIVVVRETGSLPGINSLGTILTTYDVPAVQDDLI